MSKEEEFLKKRFSELSDISYFKNITSFTDFLNLHEQDIFESVKKTLVNNNYIIYGGYEEAERKVVIFNPSQNHNEIISCLKISVTNKKFVSLPSHRDYLGAILGIGLERSLIGDIILDDYNAYVYVLSKSVNIIKDSLEGVGKARVKVEQVFDTDSICRNLGIVKNGIVASERIDSVIAEVFKISRTKSSEFINSSKVFCNGKLIENSSYKLSDDIIVSVRGLGRFKYKGIVKETRKERIVIEYEVFNKS